MSGTLALPTDFATVSTNQPGTLLAGDFDAIKNYINAREFGIGLLANRPAAGTAGAWYFATDTGALYGDNGSTWVLFASLTGTVAETLSGLTLSNDVATPNTVLDIAVGAASSDDAVLANRLLLSLTTAFTKNMNAAWAAGSGNGGNNAAAALAVSTWYHVFLIERPDTGLVDCLADTTVTPVLPANYTKKRRLGSFKTSGASAILPFTQLRDTFLWTTPVLDVNATNPGTSAVTVALPSVPTGLAIEALLNVELFNGTNANLFAYLSALVTADLAPSSTVAPLATFGGNTAILPMAQVRVLTDTTAQIRYRLNASGAADVIRIAPYGWIDPRGRG